MQRHEATRRLFGVSWDDLDLEAVEAMLARAASEPLHWEAKGGGAVRSEQLASEAAAFANSDDGGFLLVGVDEPKGTNGSWAASGTTVPDADPATWVSNVLSAALHPRPTFDVHEFKIGEGSPARHVLVIHIEPVATPPCICNGTVYERLPGKKQPVRDSTRLAELYRRGRARHEVARARTADVAKRLTEDAANADTPLTVCLAYTPVQPAEGIAQRLFRASTYEVLEVELERLATVGGHRPAQSHLRQAQHALSGWAKSPFDHYGEWHVRAFDDGSIGVGSTNPNGGIELLYAAWQGADRWARVIGRLDESPEHYMHASVLSSGSKDSRLADVTRGPVVLPAVGDPAHSAIARELQRASGLFAWEPEPEG